MSHRMKIPLVPQVVIRHPSLRGADDEQWLDFAGRLVAGIEQWAGGLGVDPAKLPELGRSELLAQLATLISTETLARISEAEDAKEKRERVKAISDSVTNLIEARLMPLVTLPRAGAKRKYAARDGQIYSLRESGLSFGKIGLRLKIERLAAQAAYRREAARRVELYEMYRQLRDAVKPFGILLKERKRKPPAL